jgi:hypothetical protein
MSAPACQYASFENASIYKRVYIYTHCNSVALNSNAYIPCMAAGNKSVSMWALLLVAGTAHVRVVHLVTSLLAEVTNKFGPPLPPFPPPPWKPGRGNMNKGWTLCDLTAPHRKLGLLRNSPPTPTQRICYVKVPTIQQGVVT